MNELFLYQFVLSGSRCVLSGSLFVCFYVLVHVFAYVQSTLSLTIDWFPSMIGLSIYTLCSQSVLWSSMYALH